MRRCAILAAVCVAVVLGGCAGTPSSSSPSSTPSRTQQPDLEDTMTPSGEPSSGPGSSSSRPQREVAHNTISAAVADLSGRLGVDHQRIDVVSAERVTWRDGSLGCPQPGMFYTQALVEGSRVILESGGRRYDYHSGGGRDPFLCEDPESPASPRR